jgi:hypothetical protein
VTPALWLFLVSSALFVLVTEVQGIGDQRHHFWYGAALVAFALFLNLAWLMWFGLALMIDDATQHSVQLVWPAFRSPVHLAYRYTISRWLHV